MPATKGDINQLKNIMSKLSDELAALTATNKRQSDAIDALGVSVEGLTGDVKTLNDKIAELQNSDGAVTPEDQAVIDDLVAQGGTLATKLEGVSAALAALDAQTPPAPPPPANP